MEKEELNEIVKNLIHSYVKDKLWKLNWKWLQFLKEDGWYIDDFYFAYYEYDYFQDKWDEEEDLHLYDTDYNVDELVDIINKLGKINDKFIIVKVLEFKSRIPSQFKNCSGYSMSEDDLYSLWHILEIYKIHRKNLIKVLKKIVKESREINTIRWSYQGMFLEKLQTKRVENIKKYIMENIQ